MQEEENGVSVDSRS